MAQRELAIVILAPQAAEELWEIWRYNADRYGYDHAERYEAFLKSGIEGLSTDHPDGKEVTGFPDLKSLTLKKRRQGDGHIVIYRFRPETNSVHVLHIFHTKMDVTGRLDEGR